MADLAGNIVSAAVNGTDVSAGGFHGHRWGFDMQLDKSPSEARMGGGLFMSERNWEIFSKTRRVATLPAC